MLDSVSCPREYVGYTSCRSSCHNMLLGMVHEAVGSKLDIQFEKHLEVVLQTHNHTLQMFPSDQSPLHCHEALVLPQILAVLWRMEFPSTEKYLAAVYVCSTVRRITVFHSCNG